MKTRSEITRQKLAVILQRCLVEVRNLALRQAHRQIHYLADAVEILPSLLGDWREDHVDAVRRALAGYQAKYPNEAYDCLSILDMDDDAFLEVYQSAGHDWQVAEAEMVET